MVLVRSDRSQSVAMILRFATLLLRHWMSVIESNESLAIWPM